LCTVVQRHGGWVERFTGDGICATFGAMQACDEHAERACHAALALRTQTEIASAALRSRRDVGLTVRIGINTGEVAFGIIGEGPTSQFATLGHDVGLAQRMESLATPGSILLTERVAARVRSGFVLRPLGGVTVKGSTDRLRAFELVTARSRTVSAVASRVRVAPAT
jgi:class 3 adenylate cyclase